MKIEIVKSGIPDRLLIVINDEIWKEIHTSIFGKQPKLPSCSNKNEWGEKFAAFELQRVKNYVIWRLSSQNYHSQEMKQLLKKRLIASSLIHKVLTEFKEKGFFDDPLWISSFMRIHSKRLGLPAILQKMRIKGISEEELEDVRANWQDSDQEKESVEKLLVGRYRSKNLKDFKEKQKVIQSLMRKGFSFESIKLVMDNLLIADDHL